MSKRNQALQCVTSSDSISNNHFIIQIVSTLRDTRNECVMYKNCSFKVIRLTTEVFNWNNDISVSGKRNTVIYCLHVLT